MKFLSSSFNLDMYTNAEIKIPFKFTFFLMSNFSPLKSTVIIFIAFLLLNKYQSINRLIKYLSSKLPSFCHNGVEVAQREEDTLELGLLGAHL